VDTESHGSRFNFTKKFDTKKLRFNFKKIKIPKVSPITFGGVSATIICIIFCRGKGAGFRPGSQRDRERGTSVRENETDAGKQMPKERKRSQQRIREDNQARPPRAEIPAVTGDVGSGLGQTAGFRLISERKVE